MIKDEKQAAEVVIGILQTAKQDTGRALGILRSFYPKAETLHHTLEKAYEEIKWVQDAAMRL